tara:strand:+ start:656 stop:799 length:144 start_codon:yes stop_codon:yes gene_type:complete
VRLLLAISSLLAVAAAVLNTVQVVVLEVTGHLGMVRFLVEVVLPKLH